MTDDNGIPAYRERAHEGNAAAYYTGKPCIEVGCSRPAGTAWSPMWCFECNVKRMERISRSLEKLCEERKP